MPTSMKSGKQWTVNWIKNNQNKINSILDLGCGMGTYSHLLKNKNNILRDANWVGIEAWAPYIEKYNLKTKYNTVHNVDIRNLNYKKLGTFDLCFMGDVLEHITKEESIKVVDEALAHCKRIIISIPVVHFPQGALEDNPYEIHVKDDWSDEEVKSTFPYIIDSTVEGKIGVYLLGKDKF
jgi:SAM-dependent methyltransferase